MVGVGRAGEVREELREKHLEYLRTKGPAYQRRAGRGGRRAERGWAGRGTLMRSNMGDHD